MDRITRRWLALVRSLLVALSLSLLGTEPLAEEAPVAEVASSQAHFHRIAAPDSDPLVTGERDEDPREPSEDDNDAAHGPRVDLVVLAPDARRVQMLRGPPPPTLAPTWRPCSARGPPAKV